MDRLQFVQSIEYNDFKKSIVRFFDENMALYNLIGEYENINCITGNVNDSSITFDLKFNDEYDSKKMHDIIYDKSVCIYCHEYFIKCILNKNIININLIETATICDECL